MSALDDCHALAAVLYDNTRSDVQTRGWCSTPVAMVIDVRTADPAQPLASATGPTPEAAAEALAVALRAKARSRAADLLRAAGEGQPAQRAEGHGARLSDDALCAAIARGIGSGHMAGTAGDVLTAIREAERSADQREQPVEGVAEKVVRHVVAEGVVSFGNDGVARVGQKWLSTSLGYAVDFVRYAKGRRVRVVVEVLPEVDGGALHGQSIAPASGERQSRGPVSS